MQLHEKLLGGLVVFALGFFAAVSINSWFAGAPQAQVQIVQTPANVGSGNITLMGSVQKADIAKFLLTSSTKQIALLSNTDADQTKRVIRNIVLYFDVLATSTGEGPVSIQAGTSTNGIGSGANLNAWNLTSVGSSSTQPLSFETSTYVNALNRIWGYNVNLVVSSTVTLATGTTGYVKSTYDKVPQNGQ